MRAQAENAKKAQAQARREEEAANKFLADMEVVGYEESKKRAEFSLTREERRATFGADEARKREASQKEDVKLGGTEVTQTDKRRKKKDLSEYRELIKGIDPKSFMPQADFPQFVGTLQMQPPRKGTAINTYEYIPATSDFPSGKFEMLSVSKEMLRRRIKDRGYRNKDGSLVTMASVTKAIRAGKPVAYIVPTKDGKIRVAYLHFTTRGDGPAFETAMQQYRERLKK